MAPDHMALDAGFGAGRRFVVAGVRDAETRWPPAPERSGAARDWHQPEHVRDPRRVRHLHTAQVMAGASVLVAHGFLTRHRALVPYGESRRAREWTAAAVKVAREARDAAGAEGEGALVAGPLPPIVDAAAWADAGAAASALREHTEHAGHLAEAGVDLMLVEATPTAAESRAATAAAAGTDLPVWTTALLAPDGTALASGEPLEDWLDAVDPAQPAALLLAGPRTAVDTALPTLAPAGYPLGVYVHLGLQAHAASAAPPRAAAPDSVTIHEMASAWLDRGAVVIGACCGAGEERLVAFREATRDREEREALEREAADAAWRTTVLDAAALAPGGSALWLGPDPVGPLPEGFGWTRAPLDDLALLGRARYRLVVAPVVPVDAEALAELVEPGGVLVTRLAVARDRANLTRLTTLELRETPAGTHVIARRSPA